MHIRTRTTCRICGSSSLKKVVDLGAQYLQGSFIKPGKKIPSTRKIPSTLVISDEESRSMNPDYYLVLPWHFKGEFLRREKAVLERGTGLIFPLPKIEIYKK
jgi:hypothetical protein